MITTANILYWIIFFGIAGLSWLVSSSLEKKFKKYSRIPLPGRLTGREVAERMLRENGITDVRVTSVDGQLTDHYDPMKKTVNLSQGVYDSNSIAAAAVAAHECGHAVQHARAYAPLKMRSALVPAVNISSKLMPWVLMGGMVLLRVFPGLMLIGIVLFALTTLFSFVTLPVEIDASRRALAWLKTSNLTTRETNGMARDALKSAAYTYVVAAVGSLATLLYYIMIFTGRRD